MTAGSRPPIRGGSFRALGTVAVVLVILTAALGAVASLSGEARASPSATPAAVFVNISATTSLSFVPDSFTVLPGSQVHLDITQLASFEHTFTLSSVVNSTIPSTDTPAELAAYFNAQAPVVNVSLGSSPGSVIDVVFTAPMTLGTYEFVCLIHFPTMTGTMSVASSLPSSGGGSSPSPLELIGIGAVVAVAVIAGVVFALARSRRKARSGGLAPPSAPK